MEMPVIQKIDQTVKKPWNINSLNKKKAHTTTERTSNQYAIWAARGRRAPSNKLASYLKEVNDGFWSVNLLWMETIAEYEKKGENMLLPKNEYWTEK